jgi:hypothetical protein
MGIGEREAKMLEEEHGYLSKVSPWMDAVACWTALFPDEESMVSPWMNAMACWATLFPDEESMVSPLMDAMACWATLFPDEESDDQGQLLIPVKAAIQASVIRQARTLVPVG